MSEEKRKKKTTKPIRIRTVDVSVPFNETFERSCFKCLLQSNNKNLFYYTNKALLAFPDVERWACINCIEEVSND